MKVFLCGLGSNMGCLYLINCGWNNNYNFRNFANNRVGQLDYFTKRSPEGEKLISTRFFIIVIFNLQLYSESIQLQLNSDLDDSFVICLGELNAVFTTFKCLGKLINGSGIDPDFEEVLLYTWHTANPSIEKKWEMLSWMESQERN